MRTEAAELLELRGECIDHLHVPFETHPQASLSVHARYTRIEILAAFDDGDSAKVAAWQTGVRYLAEQRADLLAFTLDKTSGAFSPTTRYRDYAISRELIHWESQSVTRADSETSLSVPCGARECGAVVREAARGGSVLVSWAGDVRGALRGEADGDHLALADALPGDLFAQLAAAVA